MSIDLTYFDNKLISSLGESSLGLARGEMGFCIYFYLVSRIDQNKEYKKIANKLLDDIFDNALTLSSIDIESGIAGIGLGIDYLIKEEFIKNINNVLRDIDDKIFRQLTFSENKGTIDSHTLIHLLYYWYIRVKKQKEGSEAQWLYQELIIHLLNQLSEKMDASFCEEPMNYTVNYQIPLFLFVLSKLYKLNFYNYRIQKITEEFSNMLFAILPRLNAHRLYMLWGLNAIKQADIKVNKLDDYIRIVRNELNMDDMFNREFRNKNIFFNDGWVSIYFLLKKLNVFFEESEITQCKNRIYDKVKASDVWSLFGDESAYFKIHKGLYNGYCEVSLLKREVQ